MALWGGSACVPWASVLCKRSWRITFLSLNVCRLQQQKQFDLMPFIFKMTNYIMTKMAYETEVKYDVWICNLAELCFLHRYKVRCYCSARSVGEGVLGRFSPLSQGRCRLDHRANVIASLCFSPHRCVITKHHFSF